MLNPVKGDHRVPTGPIIPAPVAQQSRPHNQHDQANVAASSKKPPWPQSAEGDQWGGVRAMIILITFGFQPAARARALARPRRVV
jgi:hypothetical protein